ncbi:hypothetical protein XENOCAPTIV_016229 [Xenoophorus captivus]|uniref:Uncharacterized protein n=1 Tax=Xenoophorus captivus TaxID=1517983 RepID=A0ABV0R919_9TELE
MFNKANKSIVICLFQGRVTRAAAWVRKPRYPFQQPTLPAALGERQGVPRPTNYYYYLQVHGFKQHLSFTATLLSQTFHGEDQQYKKNCHLNRTVCNTFAPVILCTYSTCSCFFALFSAPYLESLKIRSIVSSGCPGSSLGSPPSWTCPVLLPGDASAGYPYQMCPNHLNWLLSMWRSSSSTPSGENPFLRQIYVISFFCFTTKHDHGGGRNSAPSSPPRSHTNPPVNLMPLFHITCDPEKLKVLHLRQHLISHPERALQPFAS